MMNATSIASPKREGGGVVSSAEVKILLRNERPLSGPASKERLPAEAFVQRSHAHELQLDHEADQRMQRRVGAGAVARLKAGVSCVRPGLAEHRVKNELGDARIAAGAPGEDAHGCGGGKSSTSAGPRSGAHGGVEVAAGADKYLHIATSRPGTAAP
jgi:hypothetical protein